MRRRLAYRRLWGALLLLALLSPLGLAFPEWLKAGGAWGEWGKDELAARLGYLPAGLERGADRWRAPLPDYSLPGQEEAPLRRRSLAYVFSALAGVALCAGAAWLLGHGLVRSAKPGEAANRRRSPDESPSG